MKIIRRLCLSFLVLIVLSVSSYAADVSRDSSYEYSRAMLLKTQKEYSQAIDILKSLIPEGKQLDRLYYQIASCYSGQTDYENAIVYARKSIDVNSTYLEPYQLMFDIYMTLKNAEEAVEVLNQLVEEDPVQIQTWYTLGVVYSQQLQNNQLSIYSFKKVLDLAEKSTASTFYREQPSLILSDIYFRKKEYIPAINYLGEAVKINPHNGVRYYRFASTLLSADMLDAARICVENFLTVVPEAQKQALYMKDLYAYLGNIYYITDNPQANYYLRLGAGTENIDRYAAQQIFLCAAAHDPSAEKNLEKITSDYPRYASPFVALGRLYRDRRDTDKAYDAFIRAGGILSKTDLTSATMSCFLEAHKLKPDEVDPILALGQLNEQVKNWNLAIYYYLKYYEMKPDIELLIHFGYLYDSLGNRTKSEEYFSRAAAENPAYSRTYFIRGLLANRAKKYADAEKQLVKAIELKQDDHLYYYQLAVSQEQLKENNDAIVTLKKAITIDPENPSYLNFLGYLYAEGNVNIDEAYTLIEKALKKEPTNGAYLDSLGWVLFRQAKYDAALRKLHQARRSLEADGDPDPVVYDHIGDTYHKLGKSDRALLYWKRALESSKHDGYLDDAAVKEKIRMRGRK